MALLPMGPRTDEIETQESMFGDPVDFHDAEFDAPEEEITVEAEDELEQEMAKDADEQLLNEPPFEPIHAVQPELHSYAPQAELSSNSSSEAPAQEQETHTPVAAAAANQPQETSYPFQSEPVPEPDASSLPLTADDFAGLEERVLRAINLVRRERSARTEAEDRAIAAEARIAIASVRVATLEAELEAQKLEQKPLVEQVQQLQQEVDALRAEREQVRQRVERLLSQLDALEL